MRRALAVPLPKGVYRIRKPSGKEYWYFQAQRGTKEAGPRQKLPDYGTPEFWRAIAGIEGSGGKAEGSVSSLIAEYRSSPRWAKLRPNSQRAYAIALDVVQAAWSNLHSSQITPRGVSTIVDGLSSKPGMANLTLAVIRVLMKEAVRKGYRADNPAREIERVSTDPDNAKPLTDAAWAALMEAPTDIKRYAILARATGQRISDVIRICPKDRDQEGLTITITKLGDIEHWCPLSTSEVAIIDGWKQFPGTVYVIRESGKRHSEHSFRKRWNEWLATDAGAPCRGFTPHDLRATKVCDERIAGKSHQQISAIVGMSVQMVMRYSKHIDQRLAARGGRTRTERD